MATDTIPSAPPPTRENANEGFIEQQIARTQRHVKGNDLLTAAVQWGALFLGALIAFVLLDHWVLAFSTTGRWLVWGALGVGSLRYFQTQIWPLLTRNINQVYAAKVIEDSQPQLHNSLLNYLLLRRSPQGAPLVVVDALRQRAAYDLAHVPHEQLFDYSPLIRMGYIICTLTVLLAISLPLRVCWCLGVASRDLHAWSW
jgi:hypothetical protein